MFGRQGAAVLGDDFHGRFPEARPRGLGKGLGSSKAYWWRMSSLLMPCHDARPIHN